MMQMFINAAPNQDKLRSQKMEQSELRAKQVEKGLCNATSQMGLVLLATKGVPRCRGRSKVDLAARAAASS